MYTATAIFEQPTGILNPMELKIPGQITVEIFRTGKSWSARVGRTALPIRTTTTPEEAQTQVEQLYKRQFSAWVKTWSITHLAESRKTAACGVAIQEEGQISAEKPTCTYCKAILRRHTEASRPKRGKNAAA